MINLFSKVAYDSAEAWVGFRNNSGLAWLAWLKPGFRHCFLLLRKGDFWLVYDPLAHHTRLDLVLGGYELLDEFMEQGCRLIPVGIAEPPRRAQAWRPYSCVEAVKRALGIQARWVLTPWQLYRHLTVRRGGKKSSYLSKIIVDARKKAEYILAHYHPYCDRSGSNASVEARKVD